MSDFLDLQGAKDLNTDAIHIGAVANSVDPVTGAQIDAHVNRIGGADYTLQGFWNAIGPVVMPWTSVDGGTLTQPNQAFLHPANGNYYSWGGVYPTGGHVVAPGTDPTAVAGYVQRTDVVLRSELAAAGGAELVGIGGGRTQSDKNSEWVSVTDAPYSVKFDNTTDNTAGLTAAFTSGLTVYVPDPGHGKYAMISAPVKVGNGTIIVGPGRDRLVIKAMPTMDGALDCLVTNVYKDGSSNYEDFVHILDLGIHCNGLNRTKAEPGEWGRGIRLAAARHSSIQNCKIVQPLQHGIDITNRDDSVITGGHASVPIGMSNDILVKGCVVVDALYDDGITTHYCYNVTVKECTHIVTDATKAVHTFQNNSKAIEVDDGSHDILVDDCHAYCNNTVVNAFSISCHANAPAVYNIKFKNCTAYQSRILANAVAFVPTDATFGTTGWLCRNIIFEGMTMERGWFDQSNPVFPNRLIEFSNFMDVEANDITLRIADGSGAYDAPVSVTSLNEVWNAKLTNFKISGVPQVPAVAPAAGRNTGWIRIATNCKNVEVDCFKINTLGYFNRIIGDTTSNALVSAKNIIIEDAPTDGQTKTAIVSGSIAAKYENVSVPAGVVPYSIGASYTQYPAGSVELNQSKSNIIVGGYKIVSETIAGKQQKPGFLFDRQFYSGTFVDGKGTLAWRTSNASESAFSVCAYHDDTEQYVPVFAAWDKVGNFRSLEPGVDNTTILGRNTARWSTIYAVTGTINTSDAREKTEPQAITDTLLDVADDIGIDVWKWLDSIDKKGEDSARWHFGPIAQQVRDAFAKHSLDGCEYGLLCYDKWDDEFVDVVECVVNEAGEPVERPTGEKRQVQWAGDRWGIRPDQCLWLLAAAARRRAKRAEDRLDLIEEKLAAAGL